MKIAKRLERERRNMAESHTQMLDQLGFGPEDIDSSAFVAKVATCTSAAAAWRSFSQPVAGALKAHFDRYYIHFYAFVCPTLERYATFFKKACK